MRMWLERLYASVGIEWRNALSCSWRSPLLVRLSMVAVPLMLVELKCLLAERSVVLGKAGPESSLVVGLEGGVVGRQCVGYCVGDGGMEKGVGECLIFPAVYASSLDVNVDVPVVRAAGREADCDVCAVAVGGDPANGGCHRALLRLVRGARLRARWSSLSCTHLRTNCEKSYGASTRVRLIAAIAASVAASSSAGKRTGLTVEPADIVHLPVVGTGVIHREVSGVFGNEEGGVVFGDCWGRWGVDAVVGLLVVGVMSGHEPVAWSGANVVELLDWCRSERDVDVVGVAVGGKGELDVMELHSESSRLPQFPFREQVVVCSCFRCTPVLGSPPFGLAALARSYEAGSLKAVAGLPQCTAASASNPNRFLALPRALVIAA